MEEKIVGSMNVGVYGVISICIFVTFFSGTLIWAFRLRHRYLGHMSHLPLEDGQGELPDKNNHKQL